MNHRVASLLSFILLTMILALPSQVLAVERFALVIGNGAYKTKPIKQAVADARAVKNRLQEMGFSVVYRENLGENDIEATLNEFRDRLEAGAQALFFYSGHAMQLNGVNYLSPVDTKVESGKDVQLQSLNLNHVLDIMNNAGTQPNLVFLDASRKSPFSNKVHKGVFGLAKVEPAAGMLISYANGLGRFAEDGDGASSLYTENLLAAMNEIDTPIQSLMARFGEKVAQVSMGKQLPWLADRIGGDYFLASGRFTAAKAEATDGNAPAPAAPRHGDVMTEPLTGMEFIYIEPGTFMMGSPESEAERYDDEQLHEVRINRGFWMSKYEVTFEQYDAFSKATRHARPLDENWGRGKRPVIYVRWFNAVAYANWLSGQTGQHYRLPTEAEWEYAARAGTTTAYSFGDNVDDFVDYAWNGKSANYRTHPVGGKRPNPWGLYDMHGNVWEWTASKYAEDYDGSEIEDSSLDISRDKRVVRGGAWYFFPRGMRSADRRTYNPKYQLSYIGFRLIREQ